MLNIPSYIDDPSYRYKMPKLAVKQVSRLNGAKVDLINVDDVAKHLRVHPEAIVKFMCAEYGTSKEGKSIIKGDHKTENLQSSLDKFIEKYLLCGTCKLPEITLVGGKKDLKGVCRACGNETKLDSVSRVGQFLLKNLPKNMSEITGKDAGTVEEKKKGKKKKKAATEEGAAAEDAEGGEAKKKVKRVKKKKAATAEDEEEKKAEGDEEEASGDDVLTYSSDDVEKAIG